jgi:alkaline phosphatase
MRKEAFKTIIIILLLILSGCEAINSSESIKRGTKPRNIILFIGDGMGVAQLYAGMTVSDHVFSLEKFPFSGFSKTYSADNYITDSGEIGRAHV